MCGVCMLSPVPAFVFSGYRMQQFVKNKETNKIIQFARRLALEKSFNA